MRDSSAFNLAVHDVLARSPAALVSVQLDDILGEAEAQNLPGTVDEHPNWRRPHGEPVEAFSNDQSLGQVAALMAANGRSGLKKEPDWH